MIDELTKNIDQKPAIKILKSGTMVADGTNRFIPQYIQTKRQNEDIVNNRIEITDSFYGLVKDYYGAISKKIEEVTGESPPPYDESMIVIGKLDDGVLVERRISSGQIVFDKSHRMDKLTILHNLAH